jgi:hypothetical protein
MHVRIKDFYEHGGDVLIEHINGSYYHYTRNLLNSLHDSPAVRLPDGTRLWYNWGKLHREGGPAVIWTNGSKWWYTHGKQDRLDGPAVEWANGDKEWYINNIKLTEEEFNKHIQQTTTCEGKSVIIDGVAYKLVKE